MTAISTGSPATSPDHEPATARSAAAAVLSNNKAITILVALGVLLRIAVWVAYRPTLVLYGDSFAYLVNAKHLVPSPIHPLGYAVVLRLLDTTGTFATVTGVQHLLAIGLGIGTYVLLKRLGLRTSLAAAAAAPALLDAYQADVEQFLLAEVTFEVLLLAGLAILIMAGDRWRSAAVGGLLLAVATTSRVVGLLVIALVVGWLLLRRVGWRPLAAFVVAATLPLLVYASWFDAAHGQFTVGGNGSRFLWAKVAPIANCPGDDIPSDLRWLCLHQRVGHRPTTEFLDWNPASPFFTHQASVADKDKQAQQFARRVILRQPARYARLVARDMAHYFSPTRSSGYIDWPVQTWWFLDPLRPSGLHSAIIDGTPDRYVRPSVLPTTQPAHAPASWLRAYQRVVFVPGPLLAVLGVAAAIWGRRRVDPRVWSGGLLLAVTGVVLLLQPAATVPLDYRYVLPAMLVFAPAGALGLEGLLRARRAGGGGSRDDEN